MKYNVTSTKRLLPHLHDNTVYRRFFVDMFETDSELQNKVLQEKNKYIVENTKSLYGSFMNIFPFGKLAKKMMATQFNYGFGDNTDQISLQKFYPAENNPTYKPINIQKAAFNASFSLSFACIATLGLVAGLVMSATGIVGLLQGVIIGAGGGIVAGTIAGGAIGKYTYHKYEDIGGKAYGKGGEVAKKEIANTTLFIQGLENQPERPSFRDRYAFRPSHGHATYIS